jgi:hypothetical protein
MKPVQSEIERQLSYRPTPFQSSILSNLIACRDWCTAKELADRTQMSAASVAHRLALLVFDGSVESEVVEVAGKARTVEQTKRYRARPLPGERRQIEGTLPAWLAPQHIVEFGVRRQVNGISGMRGRDKVSGSK